MQLILKVYICKFISYIRHKYVNSTWPICIILKHCMPINLNFITKPHINNSSELAKPKEN